MCGWHVIVWWQAISKPGRLYQNQFLVQEGEFIEVFLLPLRGLYDALLVCSRMHFGLRCVIWELYVLAMSLPPDWCKGVGVQPFHLVDQRYFLIVQACLCITRSFSHGRIPCTLTTTLLCDRRSRRRMAGTSMRGCSCMRTRCAAAQPSAPAQTLFIARLVPPPRQDPALAWMTALARPKGRQAVVLAAAAQQRATLAAEEHLQLAAARAALAGRLPRRRQRLRAQRAVGQLQRRLQGPAAMLALLTSPASASLRLPGPVLLLRMRAVLLRAVRMQRQGRRRPQRTARQHTRRL